MDVGIYNTLAWRKAELPSSNGHTNARALARLYAFLAHGGTLAGQTLMSSTSVRRATAVQHEQQEQVFGRSYRQALGFLRNSPPIAPMGPNEEAFGHHGVGGSIGFADPKAQLAFAYVMNKMHQRLDVGPRAGRLVAAAYACAEGRA
jgi:CubicO group peptidase (beta-lactamase class C family)